MPNLKISEYPIIQEANMPFTDTSGTTQEQTTHNIDDNSTSEPNGTSSENISESNGHNSTSESQDSNSDKGINKSLEEHNHPDNHHLGEKCDESNSSPYGSNSDPTCAIIPPVKLRSNLKFGDEYISLPDGVTISKASCLEIKRYSESLREATGLLSEWENKNKFAIITPAEYKKNPITKVRSALISENNAIFKLPHGIQISRESINKVRKIAFQKFQEKKLKQDGSKNMKSLSSSVSILKFLFSKS